MIIDVKPLYKIINNTKNEYFENLDLLCAELSKYDEDKVENPEEVSAVIMRWIVLFISDGYSQRKENENE